MQASGNLVESHRGPALRRGKQLPAIQTTFDPKPTSTRLYRPRPTETINYGKHSDRVPLTPESPPHLKRRISKGGLLGLFNRTKSTKSTKASRLLIVTQEEEFEPKIILTTKSAPIVRVGSPAAEDILSTQWQPTIPKSYPPLAGVTSRSKSLKKDASARSLEMWDLPPLFQAYPQAVKYAVLQAPTASADAILSMGKHKQGLILQSAIQSNVDDDSGEPQHETGQQKGENLGKHRTRIPNSASRPEWTTKTFVLTTSGFILQYAGEGSYDRLPEKTLQLRKDSAAFASDAIPGKFFVLQISQVLNENGTVIKMPSRSVLTRIGLRSDLRRSVTNFLLVLDNAEEMNAWLVAVRREIAALGGEQYQPDTAVRKTTDVTVGQLHTKPSQRYLIQRDPNQFSRAPNAFTSSSATGFNEATSIENNSYAKPMNETVSLKSTRRQSLAPRMSTDASSTTYTSSSADQVQLDKLRESLRLSYASDGAKSFATSLDSSPLPSPSDMRSTTDDGHIHSGSFRPPTIVDRSRRKSFQALPSPVSARRQSLEQALGPKSPRPYSTNSSSLHGPSSPGTNFSVPSFSRRYSFCTPSQVEPTPPTEPLHRTPSPSRRRVESNTSDRPDSIIGDLPLSIHVNSRSSRPRTSPNGSIAPLKPLAADNVPHKNSDVSPTSSSVDPPVPRRYSSFERTQGKPYYTLSQHAPSPHPAPQTALPAIPISISQSLSPQHQKEISGSPGVHTPAVPKLRRPASMQVWGGLHSDPLPISTGRSVSSVAPQPSKVGSSNIPSNSTLFPIQSYQSSVHHQYATLNRKSFSFSQLAPRGPPPPMPLPAIPPMSAHNSANDSSSLWPEYSMGTRRSVHGVRVT